MGPGDRPPLRRACATATLAAVLLATGAAGCGEGRDGDPRVTRWAHDVLGLDDARARCVAERVDGAGLDEDERASLVRSGLVDLDPALRQPVSDAVTVCSLAEDRELPG